MSLMYILFPVKFNIFRTLRSGKEFSPWTMGPTITSTFEFSIATRLAEVHAERAAQEARGYQSEDEREVINHEYPPSPPIQTWSAYPLSPLTPLPEPIDLPPISPIDPLPPPSVSPPVLTAYPSSSTAAHPAAPTSPQRLSNSKKESKSKPRHRKTDHRKAGAKKCRLKQRLRHMERTNMVLKAVNVRRRTSLNMNTIPINVDVADLDHASTAWIGKHEHFDRVHYDLARLTGPEFNFVKHSWDGK